MQKNIVEITAIENGFTIEHYTYGNHVTYFASTIPEAAEKAAKLLGGKTDAV